jgi:hypothetical protein
MESCFRRKEFENLKVKIVGAAPCVCPVRSLQKIKPHELAREALFLIFHF